MCTKFVIKPKGFHKGPNVFYIFYCRGKKYDIFGLSNLRVLEYNDSDSRRSSYNKYCFTFLINLFPLFLKFLDRKSPRPNGPSAQ